MNKYVLIFSWLLMCQAIGMAQNISDLKWKKRVILVFEASEGSFFYKDQKEVENAHHAEFKDRDLVVLKVTDEAIYKKYKARKNENTVLLIGKDGYPKKRQSKIMDAKSLFAIIDAMPMRQDEMRNKND